MKTITSIVLLLLVVFNVQAQEKKLKQKEIEKGAKELQNQVK